jgi:hypothetical protein
VALAALVVAVAAGWYAKRAADAANESLALARQEVAMGREEHDAFLRELRARARFAGTVKFPQAKDVAGSIVTFVTEGTGGVARIEVGLKNTGERAASFTVLNLIAPAWAGPSLQWCGPRGEHLGEPSRSAPTDEELTDPTGGTTGAVYLSLELQRVARRPDYVRFARLNFDVPVGGERWIPVRFTAQADELPDDIEELSAHRTLRILHVSHPDAPVHRG